MKKLLFLILLLFTVNITFSQITTNVSLKCQIYASSGTAPTFNVQSLVSDELSKYDGSSVAAGDKLFIIDGSECYELHISSITLGSGSVLNFVAYDSTGVLTTIPNGQAAVIRKYSIQQVPFIPAGLRSDLASCILQKIASTVNDITGSGGSGTVTSITAGVGLTGGTITTSGTIAADTSGMLVSKDYLENQYVKGAQVNTVFSAQSLATSISQRDGGEAFISLTGDTLFHIAGWTSGASNNEIWFSRNEGYTWAQASNAAFAARHTFGFVEHEGAFYVIGSDLADYGGRDEVWKSWDGLTWTQVTDAAGFGKRVLSAAVTKGDTLFVMGGQDTTGVSASAFQDVWRSVDDGVTWVQHCASCFPEIGNVAGGATVWDGQIWILAGELNSVAGTRVNTVYSSYDGLTWTQRSDMPVTGRSYVRAFVMDDVLYCYGGYTDAPGNSRTLIATTDGENWTDVTTTDLPATHAAGLAVKNRSTFYVLSGDAFTGQYLVRRLVEAVSAVHSDSIGGVFHVSPQGNVGIGTTSPPQKLSVYGSVFSSMRGKNIMEVATQDPTSSSIFTLSENIKTTGLTPFYIERFNSSHATKANNVEFGTTNTGTLSFIHNNNTRMKINSAGNVNVSTNLGINTETFNYSSRLAVDGVSHLMGGMVIGSDNIAVHTSGANIKFTADGLTTNTTAGSDNKILKLGADGGSALASRGAILWLHGQNASSPGNVALQLGSSGTFFVYTGASATTRLSLPPTGGANFGNGTFTAAAGVVNAQNGFRVNNAATSGQYLRGNGTNFVSAAIAGGDLSGAIGTGLTVSGGLVIADTSFLATQSDIIAAGLADPGSNGMLARTAANTTTARTLTAGSGIAITNGDGVSGNPTISQTYSLTQITISGGSTFFGTTPERPDNDTPGSTTTSAVGSDFGVSGSTLDYTGASGALLRVEGSVSFSVADDGDYYLSIFKEGTEIAATSTRVTCVAGNYYTIPLPATTTSGTTNDTFDVRIATVTGNSTTTMHRYGFIIERVY